MTRLGWAMLEEGERKEKERERKQVQQPGGLKATRRAGNQNGWILYKGKQASSSELEFRVEGEIEITNLAFPGRRYLCTATVTGGKF